MATYFDIPQRGRGVGRDAFSMRLDTQSIESFIDSLGEGVKEAVRPAAQAGAQVVYDRVKLNVASIGRVTGLLADSIYQAWSQDRSGPMQATYHVSWRTGRTQRDASGRKVKTSLPTAPHGHLVEFGFIQRYRVYINKRGEWRTSIRPEKRGTPPPPSNAPRAAKDAYYEPRPGGPVFIMPKPFVRPAVVVFPQAQQAMRDRFFDELRARGLVK